MLPGFTLTIPANLTLERVEGKGHATHFLSYKNEYLELVKNSISRSLCRKPYSLLMLSLVLTVQKLQNIVYMVRTVGPQIGQTRMPNLLLISHDVFGKYLTSRNLKVLAEIEVIMNKDNICTKPNTMSST